MMNRQLIDFLFSALSRDFGQISCLKVSKSNCWLSSFCNLTKNAVCWSQINQAKVMITLTMLVLSNDWHFEIPCESHRNRKKTDNGSRFRAWHAVKYSHLLVILANSNSNLMLLFRNWRDFPRNCCLHCANWRSDAANNEIDTRAAFRVKQKQ